MAQRPVFLPGDPLRGAPVRTVMVEFTWFPGMAASQKRKSISSLHEAAQAALGVKRILEISSKSEDRLGVALSAFNLTVQLPGIATPVSLENLFQSAKVFTDGGPFTDLLTVSPRDAKRDDRLRNSGDLKTFRLFDKDWPIEPQTAFYDWLYLNALMRNPHLAKAMAGSEAFTDIEFNPDRSINCQAYSAALFLALSRSDMLRDVLSAPEAFLAFVSKVPISNTRQNDEAQGSLF